jgi:hypothetical protein
MDEVDNAVFVQESPQRVLFVSDHQFSSISVGTQVAVDRYMAKGKSPAETI